MDSSRCLRKQKPGSRETGSNILAKITITMLIYFLLLNAPNTANGIGYTQVTLVSVSTIIKIIERKLR